MNIERRSCLFCLIFILIGLNFCSKHENIRTSLKKPPADLSLKPAFVQRGIASWYGGKFQGRRTANGEIYDMDKLTAAHKTLPFHSFVEVENRKNGKKIVVRINDRGPFVKNRIIDLSLKAAKRIGMADTGTAPVTIRVLKSAGVIQQDLTPAGETGFVIQTGAFSSKRNARRFLREVNEILPQLNFKIFFQQGYHKIISKKIEKKEESLKFKQILEENGIDAFIKTIKF